MLKIKLNKKDFIASFVCFSFIPVHAVQLIIGKYVYLALMVAVAFGVVVVSVNDRRIPKSRQFVIWIVLLIWMIICTSTNDQPLIYPIYYVGEVALWFLVNDLYIQKGSLRLLRMSRRYLSIVIVITFIQQVTAPGVFGATGTGNMYTFFASDNFLGYYYIAYIALCFILDFIDYGKTKLLTYFMVGILFASILVAWSVKSVISLGIILMYILFIYRKKIARLFTPLVLLILFILIFAGVVFFNVQSNFMDIFEKFFGKSSTVSVRFYIWAQALVNIRNNPVFGFGIRENQRLLLQQSFRGGERSSHNIILELILEGGFIGLVIYVLSILMAFSNKKESLKGKNRSEYLFLAFVIFVFFVTQLASGSVYFPFYYMPIILVDNLDRIVEIKERSLNHARNKGLHCY